MQGPARTRFGTGAARRELCPAGSPLEGARLECAPDLDVAGAGLRAAAPELRIARSLLLARRGPFPRRSAGQRLIITCSLSTARASRRSILRRAARVLATGLPEACSRLIRRGNGGSGAGVVQRSYRAEICSACSLAGPVTPSHSRGHTAPSSGLQLALDARRDAQRSRHCTRRGERAVQVLIAAELRSSRGATPRSRCPRARHAQAPKQSQHKAWLRAPESACDQGDHCDTTGASHRLALRAREAPGAALLG